MNISANQKEMMNKSADFCKNFAVEFSEDLGETISDDAIAYASVCVIKILEDLRDSSGRISNAVVTDFIRNMK